MAGQVFHLMTLIHTKWKKGFIISNTSEFIDLVSLCVSESISERCAACKSLLCLVNWNVIEKKPILSILSTLAAGQKHVDCILTACFQVVLQLSKQKDNTLQSEFSIFNRNVRSIICGNDKNTFLLLSLLEEIDINFLIQFHRSILHDLLFGTHSLRTSAWLSITKRMNSDLHRALLLSLKFVDYEDWNLMFSSVKTIPMSYSEKSLYLAAIVTNMLLIGNSSLEAFNLLKDYVLSADVFIQSLVLLSILYGAHNCTELLYSALFDICDWFLKETEVWVEILWLMLVSFIPFTVSSTFFPSYKCKAKKLIGNIKDKINLRSSIDPESIKIKTVSLKYTIFKHDCLLQSYLILKLLGKFSTDNKHLVQWLSKLPNFNINTYSLNAVTSIAEMCLISKCSEIKQTCLSVFESWDYKNYQLYIYQLTQEEEPLVIWKLLQNLCRLKSYSNKFIAHPILHSLDQTLHENSFQFSAELLSNICSSGILFEENKATALKYNHLKYTDCLAAAALIKSFASNMNVYLEGTIPLCNSVINKAKHNKSIVITAITIDIITEMCDKGDLDLTIFWNSLLNIFAGDIHPAVHYSICKFLAKAPLLMKHRINDDNKTVYKSARVLWHFANSTSFKDQDLALRCLKDYKLSIFDRSFLGEECLSHLPENIEAIKGKCWIHLIKNFSMAELFCHYINKEHNKAKFRGSYSSLFHGIIDCLKNTENEEEILICLKILSADWSHVPEGENLECLNCLLTKFSLKIRELSLYVVLKFYSSNYSARIIFDDFIQHKKFSKREMSIMCFFPITLLMKHRECNEQILREGLLHGLTSDFKDLTTGENFNSKIEQSVFSCLKESTISATTRADVMKVIFSLWLETSFNSEIFKCSSRLLIHIYGYPFFNSIPSPTYENELSLKYVYMCREVTIYKKSLYPFDSAIFLGLKFESLQETILESFLYILKNIGKEKCQKNIKWSLRWLCTAERNVNDFLCTIIVHSFNSLSGVDFFLVSGTLNENLECFPLAVSLICQKYKRGSLIYSALSELVKKSSTLHPAFIEVFKLSLLRISDDSLLSSC